MHLYLLSILACHDAKDGDTANIDGDGDGFSASEGDCDDTNPNRHPEADDVPGDNLDANCDGLDSDTELLGGVELHAPWPESRIGYSLAAGDLDGDGYTDLVVGAPYAEDATWWGGAYVVSGPVSTSAPLGDAPLFNGLPEDQYSFVGWAVSAPGDMDGDGLGDMAYSIPLGDGDEHFAGLVYVIDGPALLGNDFEMPDRTLVGTHRNSQLGSSLASAGDADGDGLADLLVGVPHLGSLGDSYEDLPGRALLFTGPVGAVQTEDDAWLILIGEEPLDNTGQRVASGDFNGDGHPDFLIAGKFTTPRGADSGKAWVVYGPRSGTFTLDAADAELLGENEGDYAGQCVASAGDVDGDGSDDLLVGALRAGEGDRDGRAYLVYSPATGSLGLESAAAIFTGLGPDDWTGFALGTAGDTDNDGLAEILVAAPQQYETDTGRFSRLSLFGGALSGTFPPESADRIWVSPEYGDAAGWSFVAGQDLTGDGNPDIVAGSPYSDTDGARSGLVTITPL